MLINTEASRTASPPEGPLTQHIVMTGGPPSEESVDKRPFTFTRKLTVLPTRLRNDRTEDTRDAHTTISTQPTEDVINGGIMIS